MDKQFGLVTNRRSAENRAEERGDEYSGVVDASLHLFMTVGALKGRCNID